LRVTPSGTCPGEAGTGVKATIEMVRPWIEKLKNQDYTQVTGRRWSEESQISLEEGDAAIVAKADGSLHLHIPGDMEAVSLGHSHAMLMSLVMSGTPLLEPVYRALCEAQHASLDLAGADESVVN